MQLSTVLSDGVLAAVCLTGASWLWVRSGGDPAQRAGAAGVALVGAAATVGTLRFAGHTELVDIHQTLSRLGSLLGMPLIGIGWLWRGVSLPAAAFRPTIAFFALLGLLAELLSLDAWRTVAGGAGMVLVIGVALYRRSAASVPGVLGAALVLIAGLAIGTEGTLAGLHRIDLFHVALATACTLLLTGLDRLPVAAPT